MITWSMSSSDADIESSEKWGAARAMVVVFTLECDFITIAFQGYVSKKKSEDQIGGQTWEIVEFIDKSWKIRTSWGFGIPALFHESHKLRGNRFGDRRSQTIVCNPNDDTVRWQIFVWDLPREHFPQTDPKAVYISFEGILLWTNNFRSNPCYQPVREPKRYKTWRSTWCHCVYCISTISWQAKVSNSSC